MMVLRWCAHRCCENEPGVVSWDPPCDSVGFDGQYRAFETDGVRLVTGRGCEKENRIVRSRKESVGERNRSLSKC